MVHYKRDPAHNDGSPQFDDVPLLYATPVRLKGHDDSPVYHLAVTNETFGNYDWYLSRAQMLRTRQFICEATGAERLTYYEAARSEAAGGLRDRDLRMPEALKLPILNKFIFSTFSDPSELVNAVYEEFLHDYFPGETVIITLPDTATERTGVISNKTSFPAKYAPDGSVEQPKRSKYFITLTANPSHEFFVEDSQIRRPKHKFTKAIVRGFLSRTMKRASTNSGPWVLQDEVARQYRIDNTIPKELDPKWIAEQEALRKAAVKQEQVRQAMQKKLEHQQQQKQQAALKNAVAVPTWLQDLANAGKLPGRSPGKAFTEKEVQKWEKKFSKANGGGDQSPFAAKNGVLTGSPGHLNGLQLQEAKAALPPPPKYPIEDLEVQPRKPPVVRPQLKFLSDDIHLQAALAMSSTESVDRASTSLLLEVWNTLNVFRSFYVLNLFSFDDFVESMLIASDSMYCELFEEIHCSILKTIVDTSGELLAKSLAALHDPDAESSEAEEEEEDNSTLATPVKEPVAQPTPSRKSARKAAADARLLQAQIEQELQAAEARNENRIEDLLEEDEWIERLKNRQFSHGGWHVIVCGLLEKLSLRPSDKEFCDKILGRLVPVRFDPTQDTVRQNYARLDVNTRISILQTLLQLSIETKPFKDYLEAAARQTTETRKEKIVMQSTRKDFIKILLELQEQRKVLDPEGAAQNPVDHVMKDDEDPDESTIKRERSEESEEEVVDRRTSSRMSQLKRKREEEERQREREKKAKMENAEKLKYEKLLKEIDDTKAQIEDIEGQIRDCEDVLRETSCHRTKVLGQDRFMNRYYWYERNGMPFSLDDAGGHANARVWVQGPDMLDRAAMIDLSGADADKYKEAMGVTPAKRKRTEEGGTSLDSAREFAYYDDAISLDALIDWLDDRGLRERALRKELKAWRERIADHMHAMRAHLDEVAAKRAADEEPVVGVATRKRNYMDYNIGKFPCLAWHNMAAVEVIGSLHSEPMRASGGRGGRRSGAAREKEITVVVPDSRATRSTRSGAKFGRK